MTDWAAFIKLDPLQYLRAVLVVADSLVLRTKALRVHPDGWGLWPTVVDVTATAVPHGRGTPPEGGDWW
jgi:hypothetical protein